MVPLLLAAVTTTSAALAGTCALYFDFTLHPHGHSDAFFGSINADGTLSQRGDLGNRNDPKGAVAMSADGSRFYFACNDKKTENDHFGCCSPVSVLSVDVATGNWTVASMHRGQFPYSKGAQIEGVQCGLHGCGIMEVGAHPTSPDKVIVWVERLLPNPPPTATLQKTQPQAAATAAVLTDAKLPNPKACLGWEFVELDMSTGNATGIRPFCVDGTNATGPEGLGEGSASFDIQAQRMWFSCIPDSQDMNKEGLCYAPTTPSADNAPVTSFPSGTGREYTITSVAYSEALRATVVVAQHIDDQPNALVDTKIFVASESGGSNNSNARATAVAPPSGWDVVATLPKAYNTLNQAIATSDGKYLLVTLGTGGDPDYPIQQILTVDLVAKSIVKTLTIKDNKNIALLMPIPC